MEFNPVYLLSRTLESRRIAPLHPRMCRPSLIVCEKSRCGVKTSIQDIEQHNELDTRVRQPGPIGNEACA